MYRRVAGPHLSLWRVRSCRRSRRFRIDLNFERGESQNRPGGEFKNREIKAGIATMGRKSKPFQDLFLIPIDSD